MGILLLFGTVYGADGEDRRITLRVTTINPSRDKMQTTPVRIYLPKEVQPRDVLDKGELYLDYDTDRSLYYVYKDDVELAPLETRIFEVDLRDVWIIPDSERMALKQQAQVFLERLGDSPYYHQNQTVLQSIFSRLDEIEKTQQDQTVSRDQHIGLYRSNLTVMREIKEDLARLERLVAFTGTTSGIEKETSLEPSEQEEEFLLQTEGSWRRYVFLGVSLGMVFVFLRLFLRRRRYRTVREPSEPKTSSFSPKPKVSKGDFFARKQAELKAILKQQGLSESEEETREKTKETHEEKKTPELPASLKRFEGDHL